MENETFNVNEAIQAQKKLQLEKKYPDFAPSNGICYACQKQIYSQIEQDFNGNIFFTGISVEKASKSLITGCPHCNRSYCD
jgi:hypothetical protein